MNAPATDNAPSCWTVVSSNDDVPASVKASLRWWDGHGDHQVKGLVTLERFQNTPIFRIIYNGLEIPPKGVTGGGQYVSGALYLPVEAGHDPSSLDHEVLQSNHASAHGICLSFATTNTNALSKIQLVVPSCPPLQSDEAGLLFKEALLFAEQVRFAFKRGEAAVE